MRRFQSKYFFVHYTYTYCEYGMRDPINFSIKVKQIQCCLLIVQAIRLERIQMIKKKSTAELFLVVYLP